MDAENAAGLLEGAAAVRVAVLGDLMVDIYTMGSVNRISPEAPVPVVEIVERRASPGGAANAAVCVAGLGAQAVTLGTIGNDAEGRELRTLLEEMGVGCVLHASDDEPTITKHRIWSENQQLLRIDNEQRPAAGAALERLKSGFVAGDYDAVLISDYGKGVLDAGSCPWVIEQCRSAGVPVVIDPKAADFSMYAGADLLKPNEKEARLAFSTRFGRDGSIPEIGEYLASEIASHVAITRGPEGIDLFGPDGHQRIPVRRQNVFDVTGAGDVAAAALSVCAALGHTLPEACELANAAARLSVSRVGTGSVSLEDLKQDELQHG